METHSGKLADAGLPATLSGMEAVREKYPWFATARILVCAEKGAKDALVSLYLKTHPCPAPFLPEIDGMCKPAEDDLIDAFLAEGEHRITPNDGTPEHDAAEKSGILEISDEMLTEELAAIYESQGMGKEAEEIRRRMAESRTAGISTE